ncbi:uncharacterized protein LOC113789499 isoform X1 [Dermatophagoides pteronyssinus]|uniref:uncharacterized protein LOC113789499 isoform X1 n=1 Tax=Dermatophagoides pteronyssinus TaxID=6956 RepID=UPI003F662531
MDTSRLSNDSRRYSQSSSSSTTATSAITGVKSKWIKAFRSLKLTAVGGGSGSGSRNNDLANLEAQRAYRISVQLGVHAFQEYTYKKITACDVCREILRGHSRQGLKCKLCKINVHGQCQENAPKCQPKPRLLRKQKSASELETKITIPQIDDEKYQNYDPVYQSLRAAADARKCAQLVTEHYSNYNSSSGSNQQSINHHNYHHHSSTSNINNPNSGSSSGGGGGNHNKHYHYQHQHNNNNNNQDSGSGSGSSGSISIKQNYNNNNGGNRQQTHQQQQGSNDSLQTGSQTNLMHGQQPHRQDLSCQQQQPSSLSIKMTHRNSDSEFHQSTIEYHQQQYGSMMIKQQQSDLQRFQQQHYNNISGTSSINNSNEQSPMLTNRTLPSIAYFNTNGGNSNLINKPLSIVHQQQQQQHPSLLMIQQQQQQAYSAPHSPQKKKLTLRMKSLSLDSPESAETLKEKQRNFSTPPIPPTLQLPPPINHHPHHHSHHYHQPQQQLLRRDMIINIADPLTQQQSNLSSQPSTATTTTTTSSSITSTTSSTTAATLPPTVGLVGQSPTPPRYDSNELINHYSTFKSAAAVVPSATTATTTSSIQPQSQQPPPPPPPTANQQQQPQTISQPSSLPISLQQQQSQTQPSSTVSTPPSNQYCQMTKRFKLGIHGRMRSFERDDQIFIQDLQCSPCPSPKPQRLLPTNIFVVLYNFRSRQIDELNLRAGYMVTVVDTTDPEWWQGKCMGKVGFFPSKYVTKLFPGERPLQVIHTVQLTDGEFAIKLLREQIVIQVSDEMSGIIMVRTGQNDKIVPCPSKYLQEITF